MRKRSISGLQAPSLDRNVTHFGDNPYKSANYSEALSMNKFHTTADSDDIQLKGLRTQVNETVRTGGIKRESFLG